jgi:hypothetical protein
MSLLGQTLDSIGEKHFFEHFRVQCNQEKKKTRQHKMPPRS